MGYSLSEDIRKMKCNKQHKMDVFSLAIPFSLFRFYVKSAVLCMADILPEWTLTHIFVCLLCRQWVELIAFIFVSLVTSSV